MIRELLLPLLLLMTASSGEGPLCVKTRISPTHPYLRYTGRVDRRDPDCVRFDWPGICIEATFEGTSCGLELGGNAEWYNVFIDGNYMQRLNTDSQRQCYELASGLPDTLHHLLITKRYETSRRIIGCTGLFLDSGKQLRPLPPPPRFRIEFIGSSTTIGYGNEAKKTRCDSVGTFSNNYFSFGPVAARLLGAEYSMAAITRKGLVRNYRSPCITSFKPFPLYYHRTLWNDPDGPVWVERGRPADVVVIMLGINDFSTPPHPPRALFINHYYAFIRDVEHRNPGVHIICLASCREPFRTYVDEFVRREIEEGNRHIGFVSYERIPDWERGCNWHPNVKAHRKIAELLVDAIKPVLEAKQ